eukprot:GHVU01021073.1.p1 GENE.GHVU01021073.1~~GHVU01021073.1.p1  ORF type:complete len:109 (+),score=15.60 GHVU01021073.1:142-468(+)
MFAIWCFCRFSVVKDSRPVWKHDPVTPFRCPATGAAATTTKAANAAGVTSDAATKDKDSGDESKRPEGDSGGGKEKKGGKQVRRSFASLLSRCLALCSLVLPPFLPPF